MSTTFSSNKIFSQSANQYWQAWLFASIWNAIIWFAIINGGHNILRAFEENPVFFFVALFPLIGIWTIIYAIQQTLAWHKFGKTPLILTPSPSQIGGHCSGHLTLPVSSKDAKHAELRLSCMHQSFESKNAGKRRHHSQLIWQDLISLKPEKYGKKIHINFSFNPPADLPETEQVSNNYHVWKLQVRVPLPGIDYDRLFELPMKKADEQVLATHSHFKTPSSPIIEHRHTDIGSIPQINKTSTGTTFYYGYGRSKGMGIAMMFFGLFFAVFGYFFFDGFLDFLPATTGLMAAYVGLIALTLFLLGVFLIANSLTVEVSLMGVRKQQRIFGYLLEEITDAADIVKISTEQNASSTSGNLTRVWYSLKLFTRDGKRIEVGDHLEGQSYAEEIRQQMMTALGSTWQGAALEKTTKKVKKPLPTWACRTGKVLSYSFFIAFFYDLSKIFLK